MTAIPDHRAWAQTHSGVAFDYLNPTPQMVKDADVAQSLAFTNRYNGHTVIPVSVAQHSLIVVQLLREKGVTSRTTLLQGLVHDAPEAYTGDCISPLKALLPEFKVIERRVWRVCALHFGVPEVLDPLVEEADWLACRLEAHVWQQVAPLADWAGPNPLREASGDVKALLAHVGDGAWWRQRWVRELLRLRS